MESGFTLFTMWDELRKLVDAAHWLDKLGVQYSATRMALYKSHLEQLIEAIEKKTLPQLLREHGDFALMNSLYEASTLTTISGGLSQIDPTPGLIRRLNDLMRGPINSRDETTASTSHKGRDTAFELLFGSLFQRAGYKINLDSEADLVASKDQMCLVIECKRPRDRRSLKNIISKAEKQLSKRYKTFRGAQVSGILALSIDLVVNPSNRFLFASDPYIVNVAISRETRQFVQDYQQLWRPPHHAKTIGMLGLFRTVAVVRDYNVVGTVNFLMGNNIHPPEASQTLLLQHIADNLKPFQVAAP